LGLAHPLYKTREGRKRLELHRHVRINTCSKIINSKRDWFTLFVSVTDLENRDKIVMLLVFRSKSQIIEEDY